MKTARQALLVGCNNYQHCRSLTGCEYDAERLLAFLTDPAKGALPGSAVTLLRSPDLERAKQALDDACRAVGGDGLLIIYVSGHGLLRKQSGVHLAFADTDPDRATFTALPLTHMIELMMDHGIKASIIVLDLCFSGAHAKAAADLLVRQTYGEGAAIGHFILASSGPDEVSTANLGGGAFTQLLLEQVDQIGRERPFDRFISISALAAAVVAGSSHVLAQRPCWTGVSISEQIAFCQNPYWDPKVPRPDTVLSLHQLPDVDRAKAGDSARSFARSMNDVGAGLTWAETAAVSIFGATTAEIGAESASALIAGMVESACERVQAYGSERDREQLFFVLEAALTALGACNGLDRAAGSTVVFRLADFARQQADALDSWRASRGWLRQEDGPAAIAIAPILFWDILGKACLVAMSAGALAQSEACQLLVDVVTGILKEHPALWRVEWAGQYPDIVLVLSSVLRSDRALVAQVVRQLLDSHLGSAVIADTRIGPVELGRRLANKYLGVGAPETNNDLLADEGLAMLLFMASRLAENPFEIDGLVGKLSRKADLGDYCLYVPRTFAAQFARVMTDCSVKQWIRTSLESTSAMLNDFERLGSGVGESPGVDPMRAVLASAAAGRFYRNRSCFWVFDAMLGRLGTR